MEWSVKLSLVIFAVSILVSCHPVEAWYKQVAGPSYYSVGRASGLLSGIRRSPYIKRSEHESSDSGESTVNNVLSDSSSRQNSVLKTMPVCIKDISPNLQSCELSEDGTGYFQCKAEVFLSLDSTDCLDA